VTANEPAVSAEGDAVSHFRYLLKYPLRGSKLMLMKLDRMVGAARIGRDIFFVVHIKEVLDTT